MPLRHAPWLTPFVVLTCVLALLAGCAPRPAAPASAASLTTTLWPQNTPVPVAPPDYWPTEGWRTSVPEAQGMDTRKLTAMLEAVAEQKLELHSLLVIRHGYLISETYFPPLDAARKHELYSCTKSFIATLFGIALEQGVITGLNCPVRDYFPPSFLQRRDPRRDAMTLEHLLTMTSGLDWHEGDATYREMYMSNDWVKYVLNQPMRESPGQTFTYCSGCSHVLSAVIQRATQTNTRDFAQKHLFDPLGIHDLSWERDAKGIPLGGWGLKLTPRDMAKLGFLYLHQGTWDGQAVVSSAWIQAATRSHVEAGDEFGYGYQWWIYPRFGAYTALGRYGQAIFVIPGLDLVVVTTAQVNDHAPIFKLIEDYIVPAVQS